MKKIFLLTVAIFMSLTAAQEQQGIYAQVELLTGTRQKAQFLGIENDTVSLGGYIKNVFTVLKFPKNRFKSIVDEKGNDLLHAPAQAGDSARVAPKDSTHGASQAQALQANDSTQAATADSAQVSQDSTLAADSVQTGDSTQIPEDVAQSPLENEAVMPPPSEEKIPNKLFLGYESADIDTSKRNLLASFTFEIMHELDRSFEMRDFRSVTNCTDRDCVQNYWKTLGVKDIYFGKILRARHPDSARIEITRLFYEEELPTIFREQIVVSIDSMFQDAIREGALSDLIKKAAGYPVKAKKRRSYIFVDTDPESATISRPQKDAICKSPCTFAVLDTGKIEVNAYWSVDKHLWGAQTFVHPIPGDTVKVSLKLKRVVPEVKIVSNPVGAEIFPGQDEINRNSSSIGQTPRKISLTTPGMTYLRLRKEGYRDTLVSFYVAPVSEVNLDISMEHLSDFEEIQKQKEWLKQRKMSFIGKALMGSSIAPVLLGSLMLYLAQENYDDADDIKAELSMPSASKGENYNAKKDENRDLVRTGDRYSIIGGSFIGAGIAVFGIGLFLTF